MRRPAPAAPSSASGGVEPKKSNAPKQPGAARTNFEGKPYSKKPPSSSTSTRVKQRGSGEPIPMDKFSQGELVIGRVTSVSPAGARVALLGHKPRVIAFCPAKEMGPPRCVVASQASQAATAAALALKLERKRREEAAKAGKKEEEEVKEEVVTEAKEEEVKEEVVAEAKEEEEAKEEVKEEEAAGEGEGATEASSSSSDEKADGKKQQPEESKEEAAARKAIKAAKLAASAQPVPAEHMQPGDVRQFLIMYTPKAATYG